MIIYHIFSYRGDETKLEICLLSLKKNSPNSFIVVVDDVNNPLSNEIKKAFNFIEWRSSSRVRNGNLNGREAILCILENFKHTIATNHDAILVKLDSDTIVRNDDFLTDFAKSNSLFCGSDNRGLLYGCYYAAKPRIVPLLIHQLSKDKNVNSMTPEDVWIGTAARKYTKFKNIPIYFSYKDAYGNGGNGIISAIEWSCYPLCLSTLKNMSIVNCGNELPENISRGDMLESMKILANYEEYKFITK